MKKKILLVFGTRPEAIKIAPVVKELQRHPSRIEAVVCVTAQHREMLDQVLDIFDIHPDHDLDIMRSGQDLTDVTANVLIGLRGVLAQVRPDLVLVHGDTTTSMAASLAAFYAGIPVGHVEAGLRTGNKHAPFPEEINRRVTGCIADLHFAPTNRARQNLMAEGISDDIIYVTGNTVVDALFMALEKIRNENLGPLIEQDLKGKYPSLINVLTGLRAQVPRPLILVTGHRRENFGEGFENICRALHDIAAAHRNVEIVYPVHLNPNVREPVNRLLIDVPNVNLIEPLDYLPFVYMMDRSYLIITDSGGVQEEAPSLGKPVLVIRETTERPEAVEAGTVLLVGTDRERIVRETERLLTERKAYDVMSLAHNPYGDGKAAERIVVKLVG
jgi:UDP-N-acetylglucosamine 2-epimerase (non-hydrolysing)